MSLSDITTEIRYGAAFMIDRESMARAKTDIILYHKEKAAAEMGRKIAEAKGWYTYPSDDNKSYCGELSLYVFRPHELMLYTEAKIKAKLIEMANRDETDPELKKQLMMLSERV